MNPLQTTLYRELDILKKHAVEHELASLEEMTETWFVVRLSKVALVGVLGFMFLLVAFNNITDYNANFKFVRNIMSMTAILSDNPNTWRAIPYPIMHHLLYWFVILWESLAAALCLWGTWRCVRVINAPAKVFNRAKGMAVAGLLLGTLLWLVPFIIVGGEWFLMWQSQVWNVSNSAFRFFTISLLILIYFIQPDTEAEQMTDEKSEF